MIMGSAERFIALVAGIIAILGVLVRISWRMGQLVQKFGDHVEQATQIHTDQEKRIRILEHRPRPPRQDGT